MTESPDWINGDIADLRRWRASQPEVVAPVLPEDVSIETLPAEGSCPGGLLFTPAITGGRPVVYFHGGGFIVGSPETHRINTAWIAHLTGAPVYSIRYRLAPEHPLPAQAEDAVAAIRRQLTHHPRLRLMGDSAGGMAALWGHNGLTAEEQARIEDAVLFYPGGLPYAPAPSTVDEAAGLGPKSMAAYRQKIDPSGIGPGNPDFDPLAPGFALPARMTILAAGLDAVRNQGENLARLPGGRLVMAEGLDHSFLAALPAESAIRPLREALDLTP
jgi:acetyl esterase